MSKGREFPETIGEFHQIRVMRVKKSLQKNDTLCVHVRNLFEYIDHHYNHGDTTYPLAHNPITSHCLSGPVRFPQ